MNYLDKLNGMPDWPINLTKDQALAYTNWKPELLVDAAKSQVILCSRDGKRGAVLYYRPSIDQYLQDRLNGDVIDSEFED